MFDLYGLSFFLVKGYLNIFWYFFFLRNVLIRGIVMVQLIWIIFNELNQGVVKKKNYISVVLLVLVNNYYVFFYKINDNCLQ